MFSNRTSTRFGRKGSDRDAPSLPERPRKWNVPNELKSPGAGPKPRDGYFRPPTAAPIESPRLQLHWLVSGAALPAVPIRSSPTRIWRSFYTAPARFKAKGFIDTVAHCCGGAVAQAGVVLDSPGRSIRSVTGADRRAALHGLHESRQLDRVRSGRKVTAGFCLIEAGLEEIEATRAGCSHQFAEVGMSLAADSRERRHAHAADRHLRQSWPRRNPEGTPAPPLVLSVPSGNGPDHPPP